MKIGLMTVTQSMRAAAPSSARPQCASAPTPTPGLPYFRPRAVFVGAGYWPSTALDLDDDLDHDLDADAPRRSVPS